MDEQAGRGRGPESGPDDAALVDRVRAGDARAFEELIRRHAGAAYAVALAVVGTAAEAEDVCQDAWLRALERLDSLREPARFAAWLLQVVRNTARNRLEFRRRREADPLPPDHDVRVADRAQPGPWGELAQRDLRSRLEGALARLDEVPRQVVLLYDLEGWSHRAIGDLLGISEVMSRQHLFQARRRLRKWLAQAAEEEFGDGDRS